MSAIESFVRTVYQAPTAGRSFLTKGAAVRAEARAIIKRKYPTEPAERDEIGITDSGFHWRELPHAEKLYQRVCRMIRRAGTTGARIFADGFETKG